MQKLRSRNSDPDCLFCRIARHELETEVVFEDDISLAFLDHRPLQLGHCLLITKSHYATLDELPDEIVGPFFRTAKVLAQAVEKALNAEGSFVAINNRVSQSVPHLHVHVVPRRKGDGLKGFFWPRRLYADSAEAQRTRDAIVAAIADIRSAAAETESSKARSTEAKR